MASASLLVMPSRSAALLLLGRLLLSASLLCAATLPDPTWIAGLYDSGDEDTTLKLVWEQASAVTASAPPSLAPEVAVMALSNPPAERICSAPILAADPRAPPTV